MRQTTHFLVVLMTMVFIEGSAAAQDFFIYPTKGQSEKQMEKDKYECYIWGKNQSGFDPMEVPKASEPPPEKKQTKAGVGRGAVGGSLVGLAIGSLSGEAGKGAAIGAASGGLFGGMRKKSHESKQKNKEEEWAEQQVEEYAQKRNAYDCAYTACLEAKGYTVK
jgi:outer membrane protein with glycine zipper